MPVPLQAVAPRALQDPEPTVIAQHCPPLTPLLWAHPALELVGMLDVVCCVLQQVMQGVQVGLGLATAVAQGDLG